MRKIGFDIGITSIGWAVVDTGESDNEFNIVDCGVRIFEKAENPKDGSSLALPRREARSARRRLARRKVRLNAVKRLLCKEFDIKFSDFLPQNENLPKIFATDKNTISPWQLRKQALERKLDKFELARVILHIAKHRGYDDLRYPIIIKEKAENKENDEEKSDKEKENEKAKASIKKNLQEISDYKTGVLMLLKRQEEAQKTIEKGKIAPFRNKVGTYTNSLPQSVNKAELNLILQKQEEFGYKFSSDFKQNLMEEIVFKSRSLQDFEHLVGFCTFIKEAKRAPKFTPLAQEFIALSKIINTLTNIYKDTGEILTKEKITQILNEAKSKKDGKFTYKDLAKALNLENYQIKGSKKADLSDKFIDFAKYNKFTKICQAKFGDEFCDVYNDKFNEIAKICTYKKDKISLQKALQEKGYEFDEEDEIPKLLDLGFSKNIELSTEALKKILPFMFDGKRYDEACELANLKKVSETNKKPLLPPLNETRFANELTNPVVNRAISQYRKVLNAIIQKYGLPDEIRFELTREAMKNSDDRKKLEQIQKENFAKNESAEAQCKEIGLEPNFKNKLKIKLWIEQKGFCAYSKEPITVYDLKNPNLLEIDHILPYSRSFDDSQSNKVLVFISQNQEKKNKTPYEVWGENKEKWKIIEALAKTNYKNNKAKLGKILTKDFKDREQGFRPSAFSDTAYLSRFIKNYTEEYLELPKPKESKKQQIFSINGQLTTMLRHFWGLDSKDRGKHFHHTEDAFIVAMSDQKMVQAFSNYMRDLEECKKKDSQSVAGDIKSGDYKTMSKFNKYAGFAPHFRSKVIEAVSKIFVSKPPRKKVTGALHKESVYTKEDFILKELYPKNKDKVITDEMKAEFDKVLNFGRAIEINDGYAVAGNIVRTDVFIKNDKFYIVPIYTMHFAKDILPNLAISGEKKNKKTKITQIDESFEFCFSLFKNDLIEIQTNKLDESIIAYFKAPNSSSGGLLEYEIPINDEKFTPLISTIKKIKKLKVSPLGEVSECEFEPRQGVRLKSSPKK